MQALPIPKCAPSQKQVPQPEEILEEMCLIFNEPIDNVKGPKKPGNLVKIRQLYGYVASEITDAIQEEIAALINRDRTTLVHHYGLVKNWLKNKEEKFMEDWAKYTSMSKIWKEYGK